MPQVKIPAVYYRGGTSKGIIFKRTDLPEAAQVAGEVRDKILLRVLGSPDPYKQQIDGLGNASSSTSKALIIDNLPNPITMWTICLGKCRLTSRLSIGAVIAAI